MIELFMYIYRAAPGETVTLCADVTGDAFIKVGKPMQPVPDNPFCWSFTIPHAGFQKAYGFKAAVEFQDPPEGSQVDFTISGSRGGSFSVLPIDATPDTEKEPEFTIEVG